MTSRTEGARGPVEWLASREGAVVAAAAGLIVVLAALYTVFGVGMSMSALQMTGMARPVGAPMSMPMQPVWTPGYAVLVFLMWWIMMIAMMTPSAAPMLLLFTALKRQGPEPGRAVAMSLVFLAGYLLSWAGFSLVAMSLQWLAEWLGHVEGAMMTLRGHWLAGLVLIGAGLYQFTAMKAACLSHCQSPAAFLAAHARPGMAGALRLGLLHGAYCLGCCWALMALLFVGGIMNLYWIVGLTLYVLAEKLLPLGPGFARVSGGVLILFGGYVLLGAL
ncbi:DUF2182 domain-containing protein [Seohaeicola zhoushanensis]|uniref:Metal-binding protein n=1 Tax=Seohaeicola zhoushanensis TaxID=1569283 RepID=A0A8J3GYZ7_9RHOB|nr:DUF2182 domain-containing protein [Seohaeicola zhoushanensis]GHF53468.1 metal-binding protein [Seohaeicola zhoushanensis]